ncbi:SDR family oxidoreductase [uncultured Clostridium sp.]|uniref:SDR family NAD(P)-dependent oxidoreductase n=1 Tax=uncultured Clostridium sp. TaxID=59620 RepID=UPI0025ECDC0D|nr:SDR family oxidoreductase [uncultured Clostridium sp.]
MNGNVLITGATSGIGYEFAKVFAENKFNLIIVARNMQKLKEIKSELEYKYKVNVYVYSKDFSIERECEELCDEIQNDGLKIEILINNAGAGYVGEFLKEDYKCDKDMMQLNMNSLVYITKFFARDMVKNNYGKILNVASTGSYHPGPYTAVYYATKAFVLSFTEAVAEELKNYNISVSALCPGATKTNFSKNAGKKDNSNAMSPEFVARKGFKGLMKNKTTIIPGIQYKLFVLLPRKIVTPFIGRYQRNLKNGL